MATDILHHFLEQHPEETGQQRARQIQPFLAEMISIVQFTTLQGTQTELMHHVAQKERLLRIVKSIVGRLVPNVR